MNALPYYRRFPRDFVEGTVGMPFDLKGAYSILLDLIYMQDGRLPDDARYIAGLLGCSVKAWNGYRLRLLAMGKIVSDGEIISNFRANLELDKVAEIRRTKSENRAGKSKNKDLPERPSNTRAHTKTKTKDLSTNVDKTRAPTALACLSHILGEEHAQAFIAHRKAMRKPMTPQAGKLMAAKLAGFADPRAAVARSIENGWTGVFENTHPPNVVPMTTSPRPTLGGWKERAELWKSMHKGDQK